MKKIVVLVLCVLSMCLVSAAAMADEWDFLHSVTRLTESADVQQLAAENGLTLSHSDDIGQRDFDISGIAIGGLPPKSAVASKSQVAPFYECRFTFDGEADGTAVKPGQTFDALMDALTAEYGKPTKDFPQVTIRSVDWNFREGSISLHWWDRMNQGDFDKITLWFSPWSPWYETFHNDDDSLPPFPYPVTEYAAQAFEEHSQPFSFRNGIQGGMLMEQVIAAEGKEPTSRADYMLTYDGVSIVGRDATLIYLFEGPVYDEIDTVTRWLTYAEVLFDAEHADIADYVADYDVVGQELMDTFGPDFFGDGEWYVPSEYNHSDSYSDRAICYSWTSQDAVIAHLLEVRGSKLLHGILITFYGQTNCAPDIDVLNWPADARP